MSRMTVAASARIASWSAAEMDAGICVNGAYSGLVVSPFTYGSIVLSRPMTDTRGTLIAAREPGPHVGDLLVEVARHIAQAAEVGAIRARRWRNPGAA